MDVPQRERAERRLAAILASDVVGYSRLMGEDEEATLAALKTVRHEVTDPKIAEYRGRIVKSIGDGLLVEFASVVDAVRCAVDIQREMAARRARAPAENRIVLRIGINIGDVIIDDDSDIFGDGVNVAARLEGLAAPGGICVSRIVRDQVRDKLGFGFADMGPQRVKNIVRPVHVFSIPLDAPPLAADAVEPAPERPGEVGRPVLFAALAAAAAIVVVLAGGIAVLNHARVGHHPAIAAPALRSVGEPIRFDRGKVTLPQSAAAAIAGQAALLQADPNVTVTIRVYCAQHEVGRIGPRTLALLRANQVRDALKAHGVAGARLVTEGDCRQGGEIGRAVLVRN